MTEAEPTTTARTQTATRSRAVWKKSLKKKQPAFIDELLWWGKDQQYGRMGNNHPYQKILFGTDVGTDLMEDVLGDYRRVLDHIGMGDDFRALVMGGTAARVFGLE